MPVVLRVTPNQLNCQNTLKRHSPLPVLLMCMQSTKRFKNLDVMMPHQQGESLEVMMMTINLNVTSVD